METRVVDYTCKDNQHEFNISKVSKQDWNKFSREVLISRVNATQRITVKDASVVIRDNVAKYNVAWQDALGYHEFACHLDPFGRASKNYSDLVSEIWQNIMTDYYGKEYQTELNKELNQLNVK